MLALWAGGLASTSASTFVSGLRKRVVARGSSEGVARGSDGAAGGVVNIGVVNMVAWAALECNTVRAAASLAVTKDRSCAGCDGVDLVELLVASGLRHAAQISADCATGFTRETRT
jgi:hypothetical protein